MAVNPVFPSAELSAGMYESFYLRAVSPEEPLGVWLRYTVHKRPGQPAQGSLWCTVFDAARGAPFMHKLTSSELSAPTGAWIQIGEESRFGPGLAEGRCGPAHWSIRFSGGAPELRHLKQSWLYRTPVPRTKLSSPTPFASFGGTIELPDRTLELRDWHGMVGHNWGSEHAERWIWLHGLDFGENRSAWIDVAIGRVLVAKRLTPWLASGALSLDGRLIRLGGLGARGLRVTESPDRCSLSLPGEGGVTVQAHVDAPLGAAAGWRYADPDGGEHDVVNCSVAALALNVRIAGEASQALHTPYGAAYELGMRERDHGVALAPFSDG
jgi:hypothetical protein